jgi:hypothetical protein
MTNTLTTWQLRLQNRLSPGMPNAVRGIAAHPPRCFAQVEAVSVDFGAFTATDASHSRYKALN